MTTKITPNLLFHAPRRNAIINGCTRIWQRGTSQVIGEASGATLADRWGYWNKRGTGGATYQLSLDVPTEEQTGMYSISLDITSVLTTPLLSEFHEAGFGYNVEGYDYARVAGGNATLSFWVKSNKLGAYTVAFRSPDKSWCYTIEYTIDVSDTWEKKIFTIPLTETNGNYSYTTGKGITIGFHVMNAPGYATTTDFEQWNNSNTPYSDNQANLFSDVGNYFRLTGIQLERGDVATPLEHRHHIIEQSLCQRYYETGHACYIGYNGGASRFGGGFIPYNTEKAQANPSVTLKTPAQNVNLNAQSLTSRRNGFRLWSTTPAAGQYYYSGEWTCESEI